MVTPTNWQNSVQIQIKTRTRGGKYEHKWSASFREIDWEKLQIIVNQTAATMEVEALKKKNETAVPLYKEQ